MKATLSSPKAPKNPPVKVTASGRAYDINIYPFQWPDAPVRMYFSSKPFLMSRTLHPHIWPQHTDNILHGIRPTHEARIYTSFDEAQKGLSPLDIDLKTENPAFAIHYYREKIAAYFKEVKGILVRKGFIGEILVYTPDDAASTEDYRAFHGFSIRVALCTFTTSPELHVSYLGHSCVLRQSLDELRLLSNCEAVRYVACGNRLVHINDLTTYQSCEEYIPYPVLSNALRKELRMEWPPRPSGNRYANHKERIEKFFGNYLSDKNFRKIIPFTGDKMLRIPGDRVWTLSDEYNEMVFGLDQQGNRYVSSDASDGLKQGGPFRLTSRPVHIFFIAPHSEKEQVERWRKLLAGQGSYFKGLSKYIRLNWVSPPTHDVFYTNPDNPFPEIENFLEAADFKEGTEYFAVYFTPYSRFSPSVQQKQVYYDVLERLLKARIQMQAVFLNTARIPDAKICFALNGIALAMQGKLGGTPWTVSPVREHDLVIGINAYTNRRTHLRYRATAVCFESSGILRRQNAFCDTSPEDLAGSIAAEIRRYREEYGNPTRLIIHYYKRMSQKEIEPITKVLENLNLDIPVYIIAINKTESAHLIPFDVTPDTPTPLPVSGTIVKLSLNDYLLFNNGRHTPIMNPTATQGNPFGLHMNITCTNPKGVESRLQVSDIIVQVYQFSRLYWSSTRQQARPITLVYTERLAKFMAHVKRTDLPEAAKNRPMYL